MKTMNPRGCNPLCHRKQCVYSRDRQEWLFQTPVGICQRDDEPPRRLFLNANILPKYRRIRVGLMLEILGSNLLSIHLYL
jgi:hypothetical protein